MVNKLMNIYSHLYLYGKCKMKQQWHKTAPVRMAKIKKTAHSMLGMEMNLNSVNYNVKI